MHLLKGVTVHDRRRRGLDVGDQMRPLRVAGLRHVHLVADPGGRTLLGDMHVGVIIRFPADYFGWTGLGHQWKFVPVRRSWLSSSMQRWAMTASRSASVAK